MGDFWKRSFERMASSGDIGGVIGQANLLFREFRYLDACNLLSSVMNDQNYELVRSVLVDRGIFVFFHEWNGRNVFSMFDVACDQFSGNLKHTSYKLDFMWDVERFKHSKRDLRYGGEDCFSQANIIRLVKNSDRVVPSAPFYHWCVSQIEKWMKNESFGDFALGQINKVRYLFISDFKKGVITSTRVFCGKNRVEHLWNQNGIGKFSANIQMQGSHAYLHELSENDEGRNISKGVLGAWQPVVDLDVMYNQLLSVKNGVYCFRITGKEDWAVCLFCSVDGDFSVGVVIISNWPVRLVSAKIVHKK